MGRYTVELTEEFDTHLNHWMKVDNKVILRKIEKILPELEEHPTTGIGNCLSPFVIGKQE
jgi:toxin YoeB